MAFIRASQKLYPQLLDVTSDFLETRQFFFFFFFFFGSDMKLCMYILCSALRSRTKIFYVKIFKISWSLNPLVNLNNIW